jgi:glutamyl/glutaminyl-tRNA synthetase
MGGGGGGAETDFDQRIVTEWRYYYAYDLNVVLSTLWDFENNGGLKHCDQRIVTKWRYYYAYDLNVVLSCILFK